MKDSVRVELITQRFSRMLEDLAAIDPQVEFRDVVVAEAVAVASGALGGTRAATVASIRHGWESKEFTTFNGKVYYLGNRYPDPLWAEIDWKRQASLQYKLGTRGLSKGSWFFLTQLLGGTAAGVPAYVRSAHANGRQFPQNAARTESGQGMAYTLTILNSSPIVQAAGGRRALLNAMARRASYFERNMSLGVFRTAASRARKYPGIFAQPGV